MSKTTGILLGVAVLALGAGLVAGTVVDRLNGTTTAPTVTTGGASPLTDALQLSPEQREQMRTIWESVRGTAQDCLRDAEAAQHDRDNAVYGLLTEEQKLQYNRLTKSCSDKIAAAKSRREKAMSDAVSKTKQILTPSQRAAYEKLLRQRLGPDSGPMTDGVEQPTAINLEVPPDLPPPTATN